jgi:ferritin-like metal-binding protein YciE
MGRGLMAKISQPRELFAEKLASIYYVERELAEKVLPELLEQVGSAQLKQGLENHLAQTRGHVANLEQAFAIMGEETETGKSNAFDGLTKDHDQLAKKLDVQPLEDIVHAGAAAKTEHFEIAVYEGLINLAELLGETEIVHLLEENLDQEREALEQVKQVSKQLSTQHVAV